MFRLTRRQISTTLAISAALTATVGQLSAKPISNPNQIKAPTTVVNFDELKDKHEMAFGSPELGQPYSQLGLVLPSQQVDVKANLAPNQMVGVRSTGVSTIDNSNYQSVAFTHPQRIVAMTVRSAKASQIQVTALDRNGVVVDKATLDASEKSQYVGFVMDDPKITVVRLVANHGSMADALSSPTVVSGITFTANPDGDKIDSGLAGAIAGTSDLGLASAVGAPGAGGVGGAMASLGGGGGFGASGGAGAGNNGGGRNPGNRNPNLPPAIIPEPSTFAPLGLLGGAYILRRRRTA